MYGKDARQSLLESRLSWSCFIWRYMLVLFVYDWRPLSLLFLRPRFHVLRSSNIRCCSSYKNVFHSPIFHHLLAHVLRCTMEIFPDSLPPPVFVLRCKVDIWCSWLFTFSFSSMETENILWLDRTPGRQFGKMDYRCLKIYFCSNYFGLHFDFTHLHLIIVCLYPID